MPSARRVRPKRSQSAIIVPSVTASDSIATTLRVLEHSRPRAYSEVRTSKSSAGTNGTKRLLGFMVACWTRLTRALGGTHLLAHRLRAQGQQLAECLGAQLGDPAFTGTDREVGELLLACDEGVDLLLNGAHAH